MRHGGPACLPVPAVPGARCGHKGQPGGGGRVTAAESQRSRHGGAAERGTALYGRKEEAAELPGAQRVLVTRGSFAASAYGGVVRGAGLKRQGRGAGRGALAGQAKWRVQWNTTKDVKAGALLGWGCDEGALGLAAQAVNSGGGSGLWRSPAAQSLPPSDLLLRWLPAVMCLKTSPASCAPRACR